MGFKHNGWCDLKFEDAISWMKRGEMIKRSHWKSAYVFIDKGKVKMRMGTRKPWHYNFRNDDINATDWLIKPMDAYMDDDMMGMKPLTGHLSYSTNN